MKIDVNEFTSIKSIVEHLRNNISVYLPKMHAFTGSDTTSYLINVSKTKILKRVQENMNSLFYIKKIVKVNRFRRRCKKWNFQAYSTYMLWRKRDGELDGVKSETLQKKWKQSPLKIFYPHPYCQIWESQSPRPL